MSNAAQEPRRWTLTISTSGAPAKGMPKVVVGPDIPANGPECPYLPVVEVIEAAAYDALLAERDALKASLSDSDSMHELMVSSHRIADTTILALRAELAALKVENDEADTLNTRLSRILTDTAHVLKGTPEALHSHSWADLAQVAAALKEKVEKAGLDLSGE